MYKITFFGLCFIPNYNIVMTKIIIGNLESDFPNNPCLHVSIFPP